VTILRCFSRLRPPSSFFTHTLFVREIPLNILFRPPNIHYVDNIILISTSVLLNELLCLVRVHDGVSRRRGPFPHGFWVNDPSTFLEFSVYCTLHFKSPTGTWRDAYAFAFASITTLPRGLSRSFYLTPRGPLGPPEPLPLPPLNLSLDLPIFLQSRPRVYRFPLSVLLITPLFGRTATTHHPAPWTPRLD